MSDTQTWQRLKTLLGELSADSLETIRTIEVESQNYFSSASLSDPDSINDIGTPEDGNFQTWGQLFNLLNSVDEAILAQTRTINIEGHLCSATATIDNTGNPKEVKDQGKKPD